MHGVNFVEDIEFEEQIETSCIIKTVDMKMFNPSGLDTTSLSSCSSQIGISARTYNNESWKTFLWGSLGTFSLS